MKALVTLWWKAVATLPSVCPTYSSSTKLFNVRSGRSVLREIGGNLSANVAPRVLDPTNVFYAGVAKTLQAHGISGKKFPFSLASHDIYHSVNVNIHLYGERIVVLSVRLGEFEFAGEESELRQICDMKTWSPVLHLVQRVLYLVRGGEHRGSAHVDLPKIYPCAFIGVKEGELTSEASVRLLTRHSDVGRNVYESVMAKNQRHQLGGSLLLLDRQGVLANVVFDSRSTYLHSETFRRFRSVCAMLEVAAASQQILTRQIQPQIPSIAALTQAITTAKAIMPASTSAEVGWTLLRREFSLPELLERFIAAAPKPPVAPPLEVLLITAIPEEASHFYKLLDAKPAMDSAGITYGNGSLALECGRVGVAIYTTGVGNVSAAATATSLIERVKPKLAIFCGIAGGRKRDVQIGDVLIADSAYHYESGRDDRTGFKPRPRVATVDVRAQSLAASFVASQHNKLAYGIRMKPIASGEKLVASSRSATGKLLTESYGDSNAVEMEGYGFLAAASMSRIPGLLIRGVSDKLDRKSQTENHPIATKNASDVVLRLIAYWKVASGPTEGDNSLTS